VKIERRKTRAVEIGNLKIGNGNLIAVQTMTKCDSRDFTKLKTEVLKLQKCGAEILRIAIPDFSAAENFAKVCKISKIPLVADIHFSGDLALFCAENGAAKIRINPGNFPREFLKKLVKICKKNSVAIRVGANSGSLKFQNGKTFAEKLANSVLQNCEFLTHENFDQIVVAAKSSDILTNFAANEILAKKCDFPIHIGITESGFGENGIVKSAAGISPILKNGIGDTVRISLSDDSEKEIEIARAILQNLKLRKFSREFISCPTCGRTEINLKKVAREVFAATKNLNPNLKIAVMGCVVNGPGEAATADFALVGGKKFFAIYARGKFVKKVDEKNAVAEFLKICEK